MEDYEPKGTRLILTNENGFHLEMWKAVEDEKIHVWQSLYGSEDVYVMSMTRHQVADIIYKLETMLE